MSLYPMDGEGVFLPESIYRLDSAEALFGGDALCLHGLYGRKAVSMNFHTASDVLLFQDFNGFFNSKQFRLEHRTVWR